MTAATSNSLTITPATLTYNANAASRTYGAANPSFTGTVTGFVNSETQASATTGTLSFASTATTTSIVGSYAIDGSGLTAINGNYNFVQNAANETRLTVSPAPLTVTAEDKTKVYDGLVYSPFTVTYSGFIAGENATNLGGVLIFSGSATTNTGFGNNYKITPAGLTSGNYNISFAQGNLNITKRPITITADAKSKTFGTLDPALTYQITNGSLVSGDSFLGALTRDAGENAGTYGITQGTVALSNNYTLSYAGANLTINKATATLTWTPGTLSQIYDTFVKTVVATTTPSGLTVSYSFTGTPQNVGTYPVTATINDINYQGSLGGTLEIISPATNTTVASSLNPSTYGQSVTFTATITSLGGTPDNAEVTFYDGLTSIGTPTSSGGVASISTSALNAGTHNITATYGGAGIYLSSTSGILVQNVNKASLTVTADNKNKVYGASEPTLTYTPSGTLYNGDAYSVITGVSLNTATGASATFGTHSIVALGGTASNYNVTHVNGTLTVDKTELTVVNTNRSKVYGVTLADADYSGSVSGAVAGDVFTITRASTGDAANATVAGSTYPIVGTLGDAGNRLPNYTVSNPNGALTVTKADLTVVNTNRSKVYGETLTNAGYAGSVTGAVAGDVFTITRASTGDAATATVAGSTYPIVGTLGDAGSRLANYTVSNPNGALTINQRPITITADAKFKCFGSPDPALTAQVTAGTIVGTDAASGSLVRVAGESAGTYAINEGTYTYGSNYAETYVGANLTINASLATSTFTTNNNWIYFGYTGDQTATIRATPTGGTAPYTVVITMNRPLKYNVVNDSGDEIWTATGGTTTHNTQPATCAVSITGCTGLSNPVSTITGLASGGFYQVNVTLMQDATFTATITDAKGCIYTTSFLTGGNQNGRIDAADVRCFAGNSGISKVTICHRTGSTKNPCVTICVDESAVAEHLAHGDYMGSCLANCATPAPNARMAGNMNNADRTEIATAEVYPNPFTSTISVVVSNPYRESVSLNVIDITGRVMNVKQSAPTEEGIYTLETGDLAMGMHFLRVNIGKYTKTIKIMRE